MQNKVNPKLKQIKDIQGKVLRLLEQNADLRDDDYKLTANICYSQLKAVGKDAEKITAFELLQTYAGQQLTQADVITRARRKIQENFVHLRGKKWVERQRYNNEIREQI